MDRIDDFPRNPDAHANSYDLSEHLKAPSENAPYTTARAAGICDIDLNGHVNNSVYMAWALDALPDMQNLAPKSFCINFLEEVRPHAEVLSVCEIIDGSSLHRILSKQTQRECARINIQWQTLNNLDS